MMDTAPHHHILRRKGKYPQHRRGVLPRMNLQDDAFSGLAHLVCTALEAINKEAERHAG